MNQPSDRVDVRLCGLRDATAGIGSRPGFRANVMAAIARESTPTWSVGIMRLARYGLAVAVAVAVLGVGAAYRYAAANDAEQVLAYGALELWEE